MYRTHSQLLEESELWEPRSRESLSEAICRVMMTSMKLAAVIVVFPRVRSSSSMRDFEVWGPLSLTPTPGASE